MSYIINKKFRRRRQRMIEKDRILTSPSEHECWSADSLKKVVSIATNFSKHMMVFEWTKIEQDGIRFICSNWIQMIIYFIFQILSRLSKSDHLANFGVVKPIRTPELNVKDLIMKRDYIGAYTLIEVYYKINMKKTYSHSHSLSQHFSLRAIHSKTTRKSRNGKHSVIFIWVIMKKL